MKKPEVLTATNGTAETWQAIEAAAWIAKVLDTPLTLMGIAEEKRGPKDEEALEEICQRAATLFNASQVTHHLELYTGHAEDVISRKANSGHYLTVLSPLGRPPLRRLLLGRSFRQLMEDITGPILYVHAPCVPPERVLICLGGLGYGLTAEDLGLQIAQAIKVPVTLLHVVPPIELDYPEARAVRENWDHLVDTDTLLGRNLREGLEMAKEAGLDARLKVRQGSVVEEILSELKEVTYGLVCMGSQYSSHGLRQLYAPNVTAEVAETTGCLVLTVRYHAEDEPTGRYAQASL